MKLVTIIKLAAIGAILTMGVYAKSALDNTFASAEAHNAQIEKSYNAAF